MLADSVKPRRRGSRSRRPRGSRSASASSPRGRAPRGRGDASCWRPRRARRAASAARNPAPIAGPGFTPAATSSSPSISSPTWRSSSSQLRAAPSAGARPPRASATASGPRHPLRPRRSPPTSQPQPSRRGWRPARITSRSPDSNASSSSSAATRVRGSTPRAAAWPSTVRSRPAVGRQQLQRPGRRPQGRPGRSRGRSPRRGRARPAPRRRPAGSGSTGEQPQLVADPCAADRAQRAGGERRVDELTGVRLDLEPEPGAVAGEPQQPGRVVDEARVVEHSQAPLVRRSASPRSAPPGAPLGSRPAERQRNRVDREVPPQEILRQRRRAGPRGARPDARRSPVRAWAMS